MKSGNTRVESHQERRHQSCDQRERVHGTEDRIAEVEWERRSRSPGEIETICGEVDELQR